MGDFFFFLFLADDIKFDERPLRFLRRGVDFALLLLAPLCLQFAELVSVCVVSVFVLVFSSVVVLESSWLQLAELDSVVVVSVLVLVLSSLLLMFIELFGLFSLSASASLSFLSTFTGLLSVVFSERTLVCGMLLVVFVAEVLLFVVATD